MSTPEALMGRRGAVSAGGALAGTTAMSVLQAGGNAVDAAIAASAVQCVAEMPWCGLGGDLFALVRRPDGVTYGLNGSGVAPATILDALGDAEVVPRFGPLSVAVPATVDAWAMLQQRFATMPFTDLLEPARRYAADGVPLDRGLLHAFAALGSIAGGDRLRPLVDDADLASGATFRQPDLADTIGAIAADGPDVFYRGEIAKRIAAHITGRGGALATDDLAAHRGLWVEPLEIGYRDARVLTNGPVSLGVLLLACLRVVERAYPDGAPLDDVELTDVLVRLKHLAFGEMLATLGDPSFVGRADLLGDDAVAEVAERLARREPRPLTAALAPDGPDTTSLAVTDAEGTTVTLIHSLFNEFGARELVPGTGVVLNDRLANQRRGGGPNSLAPGKRPLHTLHTYLVERADGAVVAGATPGGRGQVQTNLQVLIEVIDRRRDLQAAVTMPRWVSGLPRRSPDDTTLYLERPLASRADRLARLGHEIELIDPEMDDLFGNCTVVGRTAGDDTLLAAADHRRAGHALVW